MAKGRSGHDQGSEPQAREDRTGWPLASRFSVLLAALTDSVAGDQLQGFNVQQFYFPATGTDDALVLEPGEHPADGFYCQPEEIGNVVPSHGQAEVGVRHAPAAEAAGQ